MNKMLEYTKRFDAKIAELISSVKNGELTPEEAAMSLAGWELKDPDSIKGSLVNRGVRTHDSLLQSCRVQIDTRLPGFQGLSLQRHFGAQ